MPIAKPAYNIFQ